MQKTRIEWARNPDGSQGYSWNPIKGLCPIGCWYCYARKIYKRFKMNPRYRTEINDFDSPLKRKKSAGIFVCSSFELFHPITLKEDLGTLRDYIFDVIESCPQHRFYILTKLPENIDRPIPDNAWLGVTVEKSDDNGWKRIHHLKMTKARIKFVSFEPLLGRLNTSFIWNLLDFDWFIFGRLTGYGHKYDPDIRELQVVVDYLRGYRKPVFLKNNLKEIWGDRLIQEFPKEEK